MGRSRWHVIEDEDGALTVTRRLPVRFDLAVETILEGTTGRRRLAHLVRQDLWRSLQSLRGFAPAVQVCRDGAVMQVRAGGAVAGRFDRAACEALIACVLEDAGESRALDGAAVRRRVRHAVALSVGLALAQGAAAQEEALPLPSGLTAQIQEVLTDRPGLGLTYRFRFVAEGFAGVGESEAELETVLADLVWLCESYALPRLAVTGPVPAQVVISLADRPSEFGVFDPDVTQVFEAYRPQEGACIWEMF